MRMTECQGMSNSSAAHMFAPCIPKHIFYELCNLSSVKSKKKDIKSIVKKDLKEFWNIVAILKKEHIPGFHVRDIPFLVNEGTGEFNPINEKDPYMSRRQDLLKNIPMLKKR